MGRSHISWRDTAIYSTAQLPTFEALSPARPKSYADSDLMEVEPRVRPGRAAIRDVEQTVRELRSESLANSAAETSTGHQLGVESRRPVVRNRAEKILQSGGQVEERTERLALVESGSNCKRKCAYAECVAVLGPNLTEDRVRMRRIPKPNRAPFVDPIER